MVNSHTTQQSNGHKYRMAELFPIVVACAKLYTHFSVKRIQFRCDNEFVVAIINSGHSKALIASWTFYVSSCFYP